MSFRTPAQIAGRAKWILAQKRIDDNQSKLAAAKKVFAKRRDRERHDSEFLRGLRREYDKARYAKKSKLI
jgi:hypothetical protein